MKRGLLFLLLICCTATVWSQRKHNRRTTTRHRTVQKKQPAKKQTTTRKKAASQEPGALGDTSHPKTVVVTSSFKPSLRNAAKINLSAAAPLPDSTLPQLQYQVPAQNLFFTYQPATLRPLALNIDSAVKWENSNYIKAGFGNYTTPYIRAGFSFGDAATSLINVNAHHTSSKGNLTFQQFSKTGADINGIFNPSENLEWNGKLFFDQTTQYQYGFRPDTLKFSKEDLRQRFTTFGVKLGLRNKQTNSYGIDYSPSVAMDVFSDNRNGRESNLVLDAPLSKSFAKIFAFNLGLKADITSYKSDSTGTINNNLFYLSPALQFKTPNFKLVAGFIPSWDNSVFHLLPNFSADIKLKDEKFILQAGWIGYYNKTTYESLAGFNPWLSQPLFLKNARIKEQYAGFKGSAGSHFTYSARVSYLKFNDQPLFVNDTITGKSFNIVNESSMKDLRIHGEIGYTVQEKFSLLAGLTYNQYSNLSDNLKAWGLLPLEVNGALRWQLFKDFTFKSDIYFWDGAQYRNKALESQKLKAAVDLNAGVEFAVMPKLNVWVQFNNLFNNRYQRWNQYQVLGFNVLGGIVYSFGQTGK